MVDLVQVNHLICKIGQRLRFNKSIRKLYLLTAWLTSPKHLLFTIFIQHIVGETTHPRSFSGPIWHVWKSTCVVLKTKCFNMNMVNHTGDNRGCGSKNYCFNMGIMKHTVWRRIMDTTSPDWCCNIWNHCDFLINFITIRAVRLLFLWTW